MMGLRMEGRAYAGNFVIADIKAKIDLPTERLCFFDPDWNPGNNVLVHRQPDDIWWLDFRLPDEEVAERALDKDCLSERIDLILRMIGRPVPWQLDWATVYSASTLTLPDYVNGRVAFVGDAATSCRSSACAASIPASRMPTISPGSSPSSSKGSRRPGCSTPTLRNASRRLGKYARRPPRARAS